MEKHIISLQIDDDLFQLIQLDAKSEYMNLSAFVRKLLIQMYKEKLNEINRTT